MHPIWAGTLQQVFAESRMHCNGAHAPCILQQHRRPRSETWGGVLGHQLATMTATHTLAGPRGF